MEDAAERRHARVVPVVDRTDLRVEPPEPERSHADAAGSTSALVRVDPPTHPAVPAAEIVEQASRTVLGIVLIVADGLTHVVERTGTDTPAVAMPAQPSAGVTTRRVAVGLAFASQRRLLDGIDIAVRTVGPSVRWLASNPVLQSMAAPVRRGLDAAYDVGAAEESRAREVAGRSGEQAVQLAVPVVLDRVDIDALVDQLLAEINVGALVDRVLGDIDLKPVIDRVMNQLDLPELVQRVMGDLDMDPIIQQVLQELDLATLVNEVVGELQMSSVVMKATGGMAEDVLGEVRNRSADGDALVERIVGAVLRRRARELPPTAFPEVEEST
jgi:hypothetical protein